mgnify:CR=1 FL=1
MVRCDNYLLGPFQTQAFGRDIFSNSRAGSHYSFITNGDGSDQIAVTADKSFITDDGRMFLLAIVIAGYSAGAYIDLLADGGVADIA